VKSGAQATGVLGDIAADGCLSTTFGAPRVMLAGVNRRGGRQTYGTSTGMRAADAANSGAGG